MEARVRIIPIPSIGMRYADRSIRRILVEVPSVCPLRADDVRWAFSGAELIDTETSEVRDTILAPAEDESMLRHYAVGASERVFRTVTPIVLPEGVKRRRIDPGRRAAKAKDGSERAAEVAAAAGAVVQALRHADVRAPVEAIRVQREPFEAAGQRAEPFAERTRFAKERLWHVEIAFGAAVRGPLVIGDGRFLGLGIMAPLPHIASDVHAFSVVGGLVESARAIDVTCALRRAVMARVQVAIGLRAPLGTFFSGHGHDGRPARSGHEPHLTFAFDPESKRLLVIAPHMIERRMPAGREHEHLRTLNAALDGFRELLAGAAGRLAVRPAWIDTESDTIFGRSREWESVTPYVVTRHAKKLAASEALAIDLRAQCRRIGLPEPQVESHEVHGVAGIGLLGRVRITFRVAVAGPIVLGKDRYLGGGLFKCSRP
jgi:CRISPR-associated protein Csb2